MEIAKISMAYMQMNAISTNRITHNTITIEHMLVATHLVHYLNTKKSGHQKSKFN